MLDELHCEVQGGIVEMHKLLHRMNKIRDYIEEQISHAAEHAADAVTAGQGVGWSCPNCNWLNLASWSHCGHCHFPRP